MNENNKIINNHKHSLSLSVCVSRPVVQSKSLCPSSLTTMKRQRSYSDMMETNYAQPVFCSSTQNRKQETGNGK